MVTQAEGEKERSRRIILRHGWNATAYQLLNPGIRYWFSEKPEALIGYVSKVGVRVVAGAPVAAERDLAEVAHAFEQDAAREGERVCYFCAEARLEALYRHREGYAHLLLGSQPVWDPRNWDEMVRSQRSLRAQLNRARNKGVTVNEWPSQKAHQHPNLEALLAAWLESKALPSLHFLVEPRTLSQVIDRRIFVAQQSGKLVGFLLASPVPTRRGWLVEQIIRQPQAPNGTSELLIDTAVRTLAGEGSTYLTLGLVPLASMTAQPTRQPLWLRWTLRLVRAHGQRFYNFAGLEYFKSKFQPHYWSPVYAISNERTFSVRSLYAIAAAFSDGSPFGLVVSAMGKAAKQELVWSWGRLASRQGERR
jgi:phosphatidylglycerol lysyltransferase